MSEWRAFIMTVFGWMSPTLCMHNDYGRKRFAERIPGHAATFARLVRSRETFSNHRGDAALYVRSRSSVFVLREHIKKIDDYDYDTAEKCSLWLSLQQRMHATFACGMRFVVMSDDKHAVP